MIYIKCVRVNYCCLKRTQWFHIGDLEQKDSEFYILKIVIISKTIGHGHTSCDLKSSQDVPFSECEKLCNENESCLSFNYHVPSLGCSMKKEWKENCHIRPHNGIDAYLKYDLGKVFWF